MGMNGSSYTFFVTKLHIFVTKLHFFVTKLHIFITNLHFVCITKLQFACEFG